MRHGLSGHAIQLRLRTTAGANPGNWFRQRREDGGALLVLRVPPRRLYFPVAGRMPARMSSAGRAGRFAVGGGRCALSAQPRHRSAGVIAPRAPQYHASRYYGVAYGFPVAPDEDSGREGTKGTPGETPGTAAGRAR